MNDIDADYARDLSRDTVSADKQAELERVQAVITADAKAGEVRSTVGVALPTLIYVCNCLEQAGFRVFPVEGGYDFVTVEVTW